MSSELYLFSQGVTYNGFTPTVLSKTFGGKTYTPVVITRSAIVLTDNFSKSNVSFKFLRTNSFARGMLQTMPEIPVLITVYRDEGIYWQGRLNEITASTTLISLECDSTYTAIRRKGLPARITPTCRHTLYKGLCGLTQSIYTVDYGVANVTTNIISIPSIVQASGYFNGGIAVINNQQRYIVSHIGTTLTLDLPFSGSITGTLSLSPGCNLSFTNCGSFNNQVNFGGFTHLPAINPMAGQGIL